MQHTRRNFLAALAASQLARSLPMRAQTDPPKSKNIHVPVRAITKGPEFHWFGYYDKLQFDPTNRYVLGQRVSFEGRTPAPDDVIHVGMIDTMDGDRWTDLGTSRAWAWQQGCMLQWIPGSPDEIIWNDREGDQFVSHVLHVKTGKQRTLPGPIYTLSPDGRSAMHPDFARIHDTRPGYGYAGPPDAFAAQLAPEKSGVWKMDLQTGKQQLIFSIAQASEMADGVNDLGKTKQRFEHLLFGLDGKRFCFLHRWDTKNSQSFGTRLITLNNDGSDPYVLDPYGKTSHFIWRDPDHILAWSWHPSAGDHFYIYKDHTREVQVIGDGVMTENGHCTYLPGNEWILNDTYPDPAGYQHDYLYQIKSGKRFPLGDFYAPLAYRNEFRCDTHPRSSRDGRKVTIDSAHNGGRQIYLLDLSEIRDREG